MDSTVYVKAVETQRKVLTNLVIIDTNILMHATNLEEVLQKFDDVHIPVEVLAELDHLKSQDGERGYLARCAVRAIKKHIDKIKFLIHEDTSKMNRTSMIVDDIIIEHCKLHPEATLITNDINMEIKTRALGIDSINYYGAEKKEIVPVATVFMRSEQYEEFIETRQSDKLKNVLIGQFVKIIDDGGGTYGVYRNLGSDMWEPVNKHQEIRSYMFDVEARDVYQACAIKSLEDDEFTVITGPAGTGKTLLSLGFCLQEMSKRGSVVHIFVNPVKTRDTAELGYYPGSPDEKLLYNFIGGVLSSKLGDMTEVYRLMDNGGLKLHPMSDIRGIEIGKGDIMYITEGQNLSIDLIKLAIQRCADGSKIIIEGDSYAQVDKKSFEGHNNGLQRVIEVFTGTDAVDFGYVNLPIIYRSKMGDKAEEL